MNPANEVDRVKAAMALSLLRARSSSSSSLPDQVQHWKNKAKDRKMELEKLKLEMKEIQDGLLANMLPHFASCQCQFFGDVPATERILGEENDSYNVNHVLFRQFLRQVSSFRRLRGLKAPSDSDVKGRLECAIEFLLEILESKCLALNRPILASYSHQAIGFIEETVEVLSAEKDESISERVDFLISHLADMIFNTSKLNDLCSSVNENDTLPQHVLLKLGVNPLIGQRILLAATKISLSQVDIFLCSEPFDLSISSVHNCIFISFQLIERLVSEYAYSWTLSKQFKEELFDEWIRSFLQLQKVTELLKLRNPLYTMYVHRITGELTKQLNKIISCKSHNQEHVARYNEIFSLLIC